MESECEVNMWYVISNILCVVFFLSVNITHFMRYTQFDLDDTRNRDIFWKIFILDMADEPPLYIIMCLLISLGILLMGLPLLALMTIGYYSYRIFKETDIKYIFLTKKEREDYKK